MKRILSLFIILVLMLSTLASCALLEQLGIGNKPAEGASIEEALKDLNEMYEDLNGQSLSDGYELVANLKVGRTPFTVTWAASTDKITFEYKDGLCYVKHVEAVDEDLNYTLTATVKNEAGDEGTAKFEVVLATASSFGMITNPVAGQAFKLALLHRNEGGVVYFDGGNYNNYAWYLSYSADALAAVDVYLEEVEGVEGGYRLYFNKDGVKTYVVAFPRDGDTTQGTLKMDTAVPDTYFTYSTEYNTLVYTSTTGEQFYMGSSGTYKSISCSAISYITSDTSYPVRLYGAGGVEEKLPEMELPTVPENYTSADIVDALYKLEPGQTLEGPYEFTGVISSIKYEYDPGYNNISVYIKVEGREDKPVLCYRLNGGEDLKVGDTITIFAGITNYNGTFETVSGGVIRNVVPGTGEDIGGGDTPADPTVMTIPEVLASTEGTKVVVKGTVSGIYYAWDDGYNNMSFYISDAEGNKLLVFRTGTKVVVGDQVTVTGTATVYNGTIQIAQGGVTVIDVPAGSEGGETPAYTAPEAGKAYNLYVEIPSKTLYFTGALDSQGKYLATTTTLADAVKIYFEAVDGGYHIYFMNGETKTYINADPYVKDASKGRLGCHFTLDATASTVWTYDATNGIIETAVTLEDLSDTFFPGTYNNNGNIYETLSMSGSYYKSQLSGGSQYPARLVLADGEEGGEVTPPAGGEGEEGGEVTPPAGGEGEEGGEVTPPADNTITTIPGALAAADGAAVKITGVVIIAEAWSTQYNNMSVTIKDTEGNTLYIFRLATQVGLGDTITVTGVVGSYNDAKQIAQGATATIDVVHGDNHTYENGKCTVCETAEPVAGEETVKCDFSTLAQGTQYADETNTFGQYITVSTHNKGCHFNTQLRIYASDTNNGNAVITSTNVISSLVINAGYKAATLEVYGSTDGVTWVLIENVTTTSSYANHTVDVDNAAGYKYIKLDATGAQIRVASIDVTIVK